MVSVTFRACAWKWLFESRVGKCDRGGVYGAENIGCDEFRERERKKERGSASAA